MNPFLQKLQTYPFEKLRKLTAQVTPNAAYSAISLGIGEPKHATPQFIKDELSKGLSGLAVYPATLGTAPLREAIAHWLQQRYGLQLDATTQILPVNGSREALFALTQTVVDASREAYVLCPNPFYQIYEGAAYLAGATPYFVNADPARNFATDWASVPEAVWQKTQLLFTCSPGNPTGAVMPLSEWQMLFELSDRYGFVIASDECYSEIYFDEAQRPLGALQAAAQLGRDARNIVMLSSLSKRSNVPGLRSGFVAGDVNIIKPFLLYRTYHGSAMSLPLQAASVAAWQDESHVLANRELYRTKFAQVTPRLQSVLDVQMPDAGFYLWVGTPIADEDFAVRLLADYNVTVLPGSYLARESNGVNPGRNRVRLALVAEVAECLEGAQRIAEFASKLQG